MNACATMRIRTLRRHRLESDRLGVAGTQKRCHTARGKPNTIGSVSDTSDSWASTSKHLQRQIESQPARRSANAAGCDGRRRSSRMTACATMRIRTLHRHRLESDRLGVAGTQKRCHKARGPNRNPASQKCQRSRVRWTQAGAFG